MATPVGTQRAPTAFSLGSTGFTGIRTGLASASNGRKWQFINAIFVSQWVSALMSIFLALSAVSELLQSDFMSTQTWWILAIVQFAWTTLGMFPIYYVKNNGREETTDLAMAHVYPFTMYIITSAFIDVLVAILLISFHHQRDGTIIVTFNASRNDNTAVFDERIVSAWYAIMTIVIACSWTKLQMMVKSNRRHANPLYKDARHP